MHLNNSQPNFHLLIQFSLPGVRCDQPVIHCIIGNILILAVIHQINVLCALDRIAEAYIQCRVILVRFEVQIAPVRGVRRKSVGRAVHKAPLQESALEKRII